MTISDEPWPDPPPAWVWCVNEPCPEYHVPKDNKWNAPPPIICGGFEMEPPYFTCAQPCVPCDPPG